jgi:hypothetical protein
LRFHQPIKVSPAYADVINHWEVIMIEIRNVPSPLTHIDPAPKPATRSEPAEIPASKVRNTDVPVIERRRNPDRRRRGKNGPIDRRTGADRRRRTVDISV